MTIKSPRSIKFSIKIATIGEISIIPIGGINRLKIPKYGSHTLASIRPNDEFCATGTQDIKIYIISKNE